MRGNHECAAVSGHFGFKQVIYIVCSVYIGYYTVMYTIYDSILYTHMVSVSYCSVCTNTLYVQTLCYVGVQGQVRHECILPLLTAFPDSTTGRYERERGGD